MQLRRVFLTGASAGIGRAIAELLTQSGHEVWGTSRKLSRLPAHANFHPLELDLSDSDAIQSGVLRALQEAGSFDVLINNAGSGIFAPLEKLTREKMSEQFQLLVFAPMELTRLLLPGMRACGHGVVVNITSLAAAFPIPYMGAYNACKAAMSSLSWTLEMELCNDSIRVIELRPGDTRTDFHKTMECDNAVLEADFTENISRAYRTYSENMERAPSAEGVARAVLKLLDAEKKAPSQLSVGSTFQARIAPLLAKLGPSACTRLALSRYYKLKRRRS